MKTRCCSLVTKTMTNHGQPGNHGHTVCLVSLGITRRVTKQVANQERRRRASRRQRRCPRSPAEKGTTSLQTPVTYCQPLAETGHVALECPAAVRRTTETLPWHSSSSSRETMATIPNRRAGYSPRTSIEAIGSNSANRTALDSRSIPRPATGACVTEFGRSLAPDHDQRGGRYGAATPTGWSYRGA